MYDKNKYDAAVIIGRFQPPHLAHIQLIKQGLEKANSVVLLIGSANQPRTIKNPWTWQEREEMIRACLSVEEQPRVIVRPLFDKTYNDQLWVKQVQTIVDKVMQTEKIRPPSDAQFRIALVGRAKDETSYYLKMFPQWELFDMFDIPAMDATDIRTALFSSPSIHKFKEIVGHNLPEQIHDYVEAFSLRNEFTHLQDEYEFIKEYKQSWSKAPYPPMFVTVDAVIIQSGHVLLVRRRALPGQGLLALPGGFVNQHERLEDAMLRELREETRVKVPFPVLKGNIKRREVYDHPNRSLRGRTLTHAFMIELPAGELPKVKGGDDAEKAFWVPLNVVSKMENQFFEDHFQIIKHLLGDE